MLSLIRTPRPCFLLSSEWLPQELLPSMPPIVQRLCVAGSGPKNKPACCLGRFAEMIEHASRLNVAEPLLRVDIDDMVHVLREVHHHGHIAALPSQAGSAAAR